mgnify:CR=1 FL=1
MLSEQPGVGDDYRKLKPVIGIHLLDFDLFTIARYSGLALEVVQGLRQEGPH